MTEEVRKVGLFNFRTMNRILDGKSFFKYSVDGSRYEIPSWFGIRNRLKFLKLLIECRTYILRVDGNLIGLISFNKDGLIKGIYVKKRFRRRGYGARLLKIAEKYHDRVRLEVRKNSPAVKFYKKSGYKIKSYVMEKSV